MKAGETRQDVEKEGTAAVIDASFDVHQGEIFVVMGLSGSGKSTVIRTLNALHPATSGTVEVLGNDLAKLNPKELRALRSEHISMVGYSHSSHIIAYGFIYQGLNRGLSIKN